MSDIDLSSILTSNAFRIMSDIDLPSNVFLTGSRKYGTPRPDSDIDLCVLIDDDDLVSILTNASDEEPKKDSYYSARYGKLNLIICTSISEFLAWKVGTDRLYQVRPCTKKQAIATLDRTHDEAGIGDRRHLARHVDI